MAEILFAGVILLLTHLGVSSTPIRQAVAGSIGEGPYLGVYSLVALASFGYLIWVYASVPRFEYVWTPDPALYWVPKLVMPFVFMLLVGGFMVKNPTMVAAEGTLGEADVARGVLRITRHPFQWSVVLWALVHIVANGDYVSIAFFFTFGVLVCGRRLADRPEESQPVAGRLGGFCGGNVQPAVRRYSHRPQPVRDW